MVRELQVKLVEVKDVGSRISDNGNYFEMKALSLKFHQ